MLDDPTQLAISCINKTFYGFVDNFLQRLFRRLFMAFVDNFLHLFLFCFLCSTKFVSRSTKVWLPFLGCVCVKVSPRTALLLSKTFELNRDNFFGLHGTWFHCVNLPNYFLLKNDLVLFLSLAISYLMRYFFMS